MGFTGFLVGMFREADPFQPADTSSGVNARGPLDAAAARIERELAGQPDVRVELLHQLGVIRRNLGSYAPAETLFRQAIDERRRVLPLNDRTDCGLASLFHELGATLRLENSYESCEAWLRSALAIRQASSRRTIRKWRPR
jgi:hypothetical protein